MTGFARRHGERVGMRRAEQIERRAHVVVGMEGRRRQACDQADRAAVVALLERVGVGLGDEDQPVIAAILPDRDHDIGAAERMGLAKSAQALLGRKDRRRGDHHLRHRQLAQPADVLPAANRLAPEVQAPGGERVAEGRAHRERRGDRGGEHAAGDAEVAGALEHEKGHGQRSADDRGAQRPHADQHAGDRVEPDRGKEEAESDRVELAEQRADEQRSEEQSAAKARRERGQAGEQLQER